VDLRKRLPALRERLAELREGLAELSERFTELSERFTEGLMGLTDKNTAFIYSQEAGVPGPVGRSGPGVKPE